MKDDGFIEVIADPETGTISEAGKIADADDLKEAASKKAAVAKAKIPLIAATETAIKGNNGSRAVSIYTQLQVAEVTLLRFLPRILRRTVFGQRFSITLFRDQRGARCGIGKPCLPHDPDTIVSATGRYAQPC